MTALRSRGPTVTERFVEHPDSAAIAARLNAEAEAGPILPRDVPVCEHLRNPCLLRCGVRTDHRGVWQVIPREERLAWLARVVAGGPEA